MMKRANILLIIMCLMSLSISAQKPDYAKMSSFVRRLTMHQQLAQRQDEMKGNLSQLGEQSFVGAKKYPLLVVGAQIHKKQNPRLCAFIQVDGQSEAVFKDYDCHALAKFGQIYIVDMPIGQLPSISTDHRVLRIEANQHSHLLMDSTGMHVNALPVYLGQNLPQAYTGKNVVVGVEDIGFDLTHPTFFDSSTTNYRIGAMWDQLSNDTIGSSLFVGRDYVGRDALLAVAHPRDGFDQTHGTHTTGIAAGSGYTSPYRGMAYESDICLVANATSENAALIDSASYYKYTYATDALGFKYIFDYADRVGKPCVINFSEGSHQDFYGDDQLYYAILDSLTGPGHIIVSSAGNEGSRKNFLHKQIGVVRAGTFVNNDNNYIYHTFKSGQPFILRFKIYNGDTPQTIDIQSSDVLLAKDSLLTDTVNVGSRKYVINMIGYPSSYNKNETVYDLLVTSDESALGNQTALSMEIVGENADVECYRGIGNFYQSNLDSSLLDGDDTHSIYSPGSAPCVISVGATSYRTQIVNYKGEKKVYNQGSNGIRGFYSSIGPTYDGRTKPDVMAPGTNIISSYSCYYLATHPNANDISWDVEHFDFNGRTYAWNSNSGTSMASPVVAGAIALWLEADPTLSPNDCEEIFSKTCKHSDLSLTYPNNLYGYGEIDVYAGLIEVLKRKATGLKEVSPHQPRSISYHSSSGVLELFMNVPSSSDMNIRVFSTNGLQMRSQVLPRGEQRYVLDLSSFRSGIYVVQITSQDPSLSGSLLIKVD